MADSAARRRRFKFRLRTQFYMVAIIAALVRIIIEQPWNPFANPVAPPTLP